eukprot:COSAG01_NODE_59503_length_300_cov_0.507463_2_plen_42_part_01
MTAGIRLFVVLLAYLLVMIHQFRHYFFKQKTAYEISECDWSS